MGRRKVQNREGRRPDTPLYTSREIDVIGVIGAEDAWLPAWEVVATMQIGAPQSAHKRAEGDDRRPLWNANIHYHSLLVDAIPQGARRVLDVGCGDGVLSAHLVQTGIPHVVGLDVDGQVLERAQTRHAGIAVEWVQGDLLDVPFEAGSFDAVVSVATLHHVPAERALAQFAEWVRPGGVVAVIGLAANDWWDFPYAVFAHGSQLVLRAWHGHWEHSAPMVWPPPSTYLEMKRIARRVLPGVRYRRRLLGRFSLIWTKPLPSAG